MYKLAKWIPGMSVLYVFTVMNAAIIIEAGMTIT